MKICFVSLSRKRARYFTQLSEAAPEGVEAKVIPGVRFDLHLARSLFSFCPGFDFGLQAHERRQMLNYPRLFRLRIVRRLMSGLLVYVESVRYHYFRRVFAQEQANVLAVWNGQKLPYTTLVLAARHVGMRVVFFENGGLPDTTTVDCKGVNAQNCLPREPDFYRSFYYTSLSVISELPKVEPSEKSRIFVPLQVESDTQMVLHSPWISSSNELVREVIAAAKSHIEAGAEVLVKPHPKARTVIALPEVPRVSLVVEDNISDLLAEAAVVVTVNSTVGLEAIAAGHKVIVLGEAFYGISGVACRARSSAELNHCLDAVLTGGWQMDVQLAGDFVRFLRDVYYIPQDWRRGDRLAAQHFKAVWQRILQRDALAQICGPP